LYYIVLEKVQTVSGLDTGLIIVELFWYIHHPIPGVDTDHVKVVISQDQIV